MMKPFLEEDKNIEHESELAEKDPSQDVLFYSGLEPENNGERACNLFVEQIN